MKTIKMTSLIFMFALPALLLGQSKFIPEDDIYVSRGEENAIVQKSQKEQSKRNNEYETPSTNRRDVDEYNRRYSQNQQTSKDTVANYNQQGQEGQYVNGFNGSESDYEYAERIRRFHNPRFLVHISDPAYSDIYFLNNYDWNVYTNGYEAWVTPTWTNPYYFNYMYSPFSYYPSWGMGYGRFNSWYDPWYSGWGGFGYSNYGYYGGYNNGYNNYYGYGGGYYGGYGHTPNQRYDGGRRPTTDGYVSRGNNTSNNSTSRSSRYTTSPDVRSTTDGSNSYNAGGRSYRYTVPTTDNSSQGNGSSTNSGRTGRYTQPSGATYSAPVPSTDQRATRNTQPVNATPRTSYSTGSSESTSRSSSSYSSGNNNSGGRSSSYSAPSSNYGSSSPSSSSSNSGSSSSGSSGRSSGGRR